MPTKVAQSKIRSWIKRAEQNVFVPKACRLSSRADYHQTTVLLSSIRKSGRGELGTSFIGISREREKKKKRTKEREKSFLESQKIDHNQIHI